MLWVLTREGELAKCLGFDRCREGWPVVWGPSMCVGKLSPKFLRPFFFSSMLKDM